MASAGAISSSQLSLDESRVSPVKPFLKRSTRKRAAEQELKTPEKRKSGPHPRRLRFEPLKLVPSSSAAAAAVAPATAAAVAVERIPMTAVTARNGARDEPAEAERVYTYLAEPPGSPDMSTPSFFRQWFSKCSGRAGMEQTLNSWDMEVSSYEDVRSIVQDGILANPDPDASRNFVDFLLWAKENNRANPRLIEIALGLMESDRPICSALNPPFDSSLTQPPPPLPSSPLSSGHYDLPPTQPDSPCLPPLSPLSLGPTAPQHPLSPPPLAPATPPSLAAAPPAMTVPGTPDPPSRIIKVGIMRSHVETIAYAAALLGKAGAKRLLRDDPASHESGRHLVAINRVLESIVAAAGVSVDSKDYPAIVARLS